MTFSDKKPDREGFYWARMSTPSGNEIDRVVHAYRCLKDGETRPDLVFSDGENFSISSLRFLKWAGPIEEPTDVYPHYQRDVPRGL